MTSRSRQKRGSILLLATLSMTALLGIAALAIDASYLFEYRNRMSAATDAAAETAAFEIMRNPALTWLQLSYFAEHEAALPAFGFVNGVDGVSVTVNTPPSTGLFSSDARFVEVIISRPVSTFFLRVLGRSVMTVTTRAVAGPGQSPNNLVVLSPTGLPGMQLSSGAQLTVSGSVVVDSVFSGALDAGGASGAMLTAGPGGISVTGASTDCGCSPTPQDHVPPSPDPLSVLGIPTSTGSTFAGVTYANAGPVTLSPGTYTGDIQITGTTNATFNAGVYVLQGGSLTVSGGGSASGTDVTFYVTSDASSHFGAVTISGTPLSAGVTNTVSFAAPATGSNAGILFFQDRSNTQPFTISNGAIVQLTGLIYARASTFIYAGGTGSGSRAAYTDIVVNTFTQTAGTLTLGNNYKSLAEGNPLKRVTLAE